MCSPKRDARCVIVAMASAFEGLEPSSVGNRGMARGSSDRSLAKALQYASWSMSACKGHGMSMLPPHVHPHDRIVPNALTSVLLEGNIKVALSSEEVKDMWPASALLSSISLHKK